MTLDFWKIAMRPGKPLMSGKLDRMQVLGLPGNPVSSLVCTHLFAVPLIKAMLGLPPGPHLQRATLGTDLPANDMRQDYLRASLARDASGGLVASPFSPQDSSMMRLFSLSDCLIVRPPDAPSAAAGDACDVLMLRSHDQGVSAA
jgi:molybdopterin molybdotransferase